MPGPARRPPRPASLALVLATGMLTLSVSSAVREQLTRQFPLKSGGRLTIENTRGDIVIRAWEKEMIDLHAEKTADSSEEMPLVPIEFEAADDLVRVRSQFPAYAPKLRTTVNYTLKVPSRIDLRLLRTTRGRIDVEGTTGRIVAQTTTGAVKLTGVAGTLDVIATNGDINAVVTDVRVNDFVRLESYNGDIVLRLPSRLRPNLEVRTLNGSIDSDFPLDVQSAYGPRIARQESGPNNPFVRVVSIGGNIRLASR
ncbi:MAG: hypothetical protein HYX76_15380 [Acidobacteria bacterium]|nr:hypothetical protein [Acidobacteriota bacterium]